MSGPDVSVVLANRDAGAALEECLRSLDRQCFSGTAETLVADCSGDATQERIRAQFPLVKLLRFSSPAALPQLLRDAMLQARGRVIAVTDPHCRFPEDWLQKLQRAHQSDFAVIGGAVENGRPAGLLAWACFFADYGAFMLPAERSVTDLLPGNHVSYKSDLLDECCDALQNGFYKVFFHWELARRGIRFLFDPELVVHYACPHTFRGFASRYYRHGRAFASLRSRNTLRAERWLRALFAPLLPAWLLYRRLRPVLGKKRHLRELLLSIPLLALFVAAWSLGEFVGYVSGPGGSRPEADLW